MTKLLRTSAFSAAVILAVAILSLGAIFPGSAFAQKAHNMRLVGMDNLQARSAYLPIVQGYPDGSFIAFVGHHGGSAPNPMEGGVTEINGTSIVDVTDPANPVYLKHLPPTQVAGRNTASGAQMAQTCLIGGTMYLLRSNGNISHEVWDVSNPAVPTFVSEPVFEAGANGTHKNWWDCDSGIAYIVYDGRQRGWFERRILWVVDLSDPANPDFIRNFGLDGQQPADPAPDSPPAGMHEITSYGDRLFAAYGTGNDGVLQIIDTETLLSNCVDPDPCATDPSAQDLNDPQIGRVDMPTFWGGHTAFPLIGIPVPEQSGFNDSDPRDFVVLVSESLANECNEGSHDMVFMVDITHESKPFPVANYQVPESEGDFCSVGGRFGAHSMNWSFNPDFYNKMIAVAYFNAGVRMVDVRDPFHPVEAAYFIPEVTEDTASRGDFFAIQTNNVELDDRGFVYLADRANTGMHIVELTGNAKKIVK